MNNKEGFSDAHRATMDLDAESPSRILEDLNSLTCDAQISAAYAYRDGINGIFTQEDPYNRFGDAVPKYIELIYSLDKIITQE